MSVYGEVEVKKRQYVKTHQRAGSKVKGYYRTVTVREQRRWDLKGTKPELRTAIIYIKRRSAAPKVRHKRISTRVFLRKPKKWIDRYELKAPQADSTFCPICGRRLYYNHGHGICSVHGVVF